MRPDLGKQIRKNISAEDIYGKEAVNRYYNYINNKAVDESFTTAGDNFEGSSQYDAGISRDEAVYGDVNEHRANLQSNADKIANGANRLLLTSLTKTGQGVGYLAGLIDPTNWGNDYISKAADNGFAQMFNTAEDEIKKQFPLYNTKADLSEGLFKRAATDLDFWMDDVVDGVAFMVSTYVPGIVLSQIGTGVKLANSSAKVLGLFDKSLEMTRAGEITLPKLRTLANSIDKTTQFATMTSMEAMFEADDVKKTLISKLSSDRENGLNNYSDDQIKHIAADKAKNTYLQNLIALAPSNLFEVGAFLKGSSKVIPSASNKIEGLAANLVEGAKNGELTGWSKFANSKVGSGIVGATETAVAEGLYEENIQYSIQKFNEKYGKLGQTDNFLQTLSDVTASLVDPEEYKDKERQKNIFLGSVVGLGPGAIGSIRENSREEKIKQSVIKGLNTDITNSKNVLKNLYERDADGKVIFDENNNPKYNVEGLAKLINDREQIEELNRIANNDQDKNNILAKIAKDTKFDRLAKSFFNNGLAEDLHRSLKTANNYSEEDLLDLFGLDPYEVDSNGNRRSKNSIIKHYQDRAKKLESLYNSLEFGILNGTSKDEQEVNRVRKDELFNLGSQILTLHDHKKEQESELNKLKLESGNTDSLINEYNTLIEKRNDLNKIPEDTYKQKFLLDKQIELFKQTYDLIFQDKKFEDDGSINLTNHPLTKAFKTASLKHSELLNGIDRVTSEWEKLSQPIVAKDYVDQYFDRKKEKFTGFNIDKDGLDQYLKYENKILKDKMYSLNLKNIDNEFFKEAIKFRLNDPEDKDTDILKDILKDKIPLDKETLDYLKSTINEHIINAPNYTELIELKKDEINYMDSEGQDVSELEQELQNLIDQEKELIEATQYLKELDKVPVYKPEKISEQDVKEKIAKEFIIENNIIFENERDLGELYSDQAALDSIERQISNTTKLLTIFNTRKDKDKFEKLINELETDLIKLKEISDKVSKRLADRKTQQEIILKNNTELNYNSIGLTSEGKTLPERKLLVEIISEVINDEKFNNILKDISEEERKIIYPEIIKQILRKSDSDKKLKVLEEIQRLLNIQFNKIFDISKIKEIYDNPLTIAGYDSANGTPGQLYVNLYKENPERFFELLLNKINLNDGRFTKLIETYNSHKDIFKFKKEVDQIQNSFPESKVIKDFIDFHLNYLPLITLQNELNLNSTFDIQYQLDKEKELNEFEITPSNEQIIAIRELTKFLNTTYPKNIFSNFAYLKGFAGTGKSTIVMKWVINCTKDLFKFENIYVSGHNDSSAKTLQTVIKNKDENTGSIETFIKQATENPESLANISLLLLDEVGAISSSTLRELSLLINSLNETRAINPIKVVMLGDPNQTTAEDVDSPIDNVEEFLENKNKYNHGRGIVSIKPLTIRYRSNISSIVELQDKFLNQSKDLTEENFTLKVNSDDFSQSDLLGTYGVKTIGEFKDKLIELLKLRNKIPSTKAIIVSQNYINDFKELVKNNNFDNIEILTPTQAQGKTIDEVYTFITPKQKLDNDYVIKQYNKEVYTATSRATKFLMLGNFNTTNTVNNESIIANKELQEKELTEAKTIFNTNIIIDIKQADKYLKDTVDSEIEPETKEKTDIETEPEIDEETIVLDEDDKEGDDDLADIPEPPKPIIPQPPVILNDFPRHILNFPKQGSLKLKDENGNSVVKAGDDILYVFDKEDRVHHVKIVKVLPDNKFIEIGRLSPEELSDSNADSSLKQIFENLLFNLKDDAVLSNIYNGKLINLETSIAAKIIYAQKLTYLYGYEYDKNPWNIIKERILSIFVNRMNTYGAGLQPLKDQGVVKIFTKKEIKELNNKGKIGDYNPKPGIPYLFIESPFQNNSKQQNVISQFIQLSRKKLNIKNHSYITEPIKELIVHLEEFNNLSDLKFGTEQGNLFINYIRNNTESDTKLPKKTWDSVRPIWNSLDHSIQLKLREVCKKIDGLIFKESKLEVGHKVKMANDDIGFQYKDKKGEIKTINLVIHSFDKDYEKVFLIAPKTLVDSEKYTIIKSTEGKDLIELPKSEVLPTKRTSGPAQAAFNALAGGNLDLRYNNKLHKILRTYRNTEKEILISGKSLLSDTKPKHLLRLENNKVLDRSLIKFLKDLGYDKEAAEKETLTSLKINNPDMYNLFKTNVLSAIDDYFINIDDLKAIISEDEEGNSNTNLRVPLPQDFGNTRWVNKFFHSTGEKQDVGNYIESNFKDIVPTTIITQFVKKPDIKVPNNSKENTTNSSGLPSKKGKNAPKLLSKSVVKGKSLGELLSSDQVLNFIRERIKDFKVEDIQFIDDLQMMKLSEGNEAWGLFKDGVIYLLKNGDNKTYSQVVKHELFHKVFNNHLNIKERNKALKLIKDIHGNISDIEAEEILARKYQIYELTNQEKGFIQTIFKKIKKFFSFWFKNFNTVNELFNKIEEGYFSKPVNDDFKGSRLLSRIKEDWGTVDSFINGRNLFINKLEEYLNNYNKVEYEEDLPLTRDEALHYIFDDFRERLNDINNFIFSEPGSIEDRLKAFTKTENEYNNYEILLKEYEALKILSNLKTYKRLVEDFYPTIKFKKAIDGKFIIEEDFSPEELELQIENALQNNNLYRDHIQEADQVNHELKLSRAAKDFLSLIRNSNGKIVNEKYAFTLITEKLESLNFNNISNVLNEIEAQWKNLIHPDQIAIKEKLIELIKFATNKIDQFGKPLSTNNYFIDENNFKTPEGIISKGELNTREFIVKLNKVTKLSYDDLKSLFIRMNSNNTLAELISTTGSLTKKNVKYGIKDFNESFLPIYKYNSMSESNVKEVIENQVELALINNIEDLYNSNFGIQKWKTGDTNSIEIIQTLLAYLNFDGNFFIDKISADNIIEDFQRIFSIIHTNKKTDNFNVQDIIKDSSDRIKNLVNIVSTTLVDNTASSYRAGDGTTRWFYTLSSQAHDIINSFFKGKFKRTPEFLSSTLYKNNIFGEQKLNTIHNIINHDSVKQKDSDFTVNYSRETEKGWYERNVLYNFLAYIKTYAPINNKKRYVQQFWTISNKPSPQATEVNILSYKDINEGIKQAILSEVNRPEITHINFDRNLTSIPGLTSQDIIDLRSTSEDQSTKIDNLINNKVLPALEKQRDEVINNITNQKIQIHGELYYIYDQLKDIFKDSQFTDLSTPGISSQGFQNNSKYDNNKEQIKKEITPIIDLWVKNFFVNSYHLNRLIAGDEAFYKGLFDITKRMSIAFATGNKPIVNEEFTDRKYKIAVVQDIVTILGEEKYKKFKKLYKNEFESSDAAGFMTSKRADNIKKGFGKAMKLGNIFKPVYFGINEQGIPTAIKYSCVELTEELMNMFPELRTLNENMINSGVSEYVFKSAVKVGFPNKLSKWNEKIEPTSILELDNNNYRIQLNKSHKAYDEVALPTQLMYFINSDGNNLNAALNIYQLQASLIQLGINKALKKINWYKDPKISSEQDIANAKVAIRKMVLESLDNLQGSEREFEFVNNDNISINFPTIVNKIITQFNASMSKSMVKIDFAGGGLVMQTDVGTYTVIDKNSKEQKKQKLKSVITDDTYYVECYVSEELAKYVNNKGYLLGFRIPSTEKHSAVPLKVMGYLPGNQNTIIVADDIVGLHGSDFDIDVLYAMAYEDPKSSSDPQAAIIKNKILDQLINVFTDPKNINEMLIPITMDRFKSMKSVDNNKESIFGLIARLKGFKGGSIKDRNKFLYEQTNINFPTTQQKMHADNFNGVGLTGAFANVPKAINYLINSSELIGEMPLLKDDKTDDDGDVIKGNYLELNGNKYSTVKRVNEDEIPVREITDSFINAATDAVKEQILNVINATDITGNALMAMLNLGIGLNKVITIMIQPSIIELNNYGDVSIAVNLTKNKIRKLISSFDEKKPEDFDYKNLNINTDEIESTAFKSLDKLTLDELYMQLRILDEFDKANTIGKALFTTSKALKVIQSFPVIFEEIQDLLDEWKKIIAFDPNQNDFLKDENGNFQFNEGFPFTNTNITLLPHIKLAFEQLINQKKRIELITFKHNEHLQEFAKKIKNFLKSTDKDFKIAKTDNASLRLIREEFIKYLLSDLKYISNGISYDLNTNNETPVKIKTKLGEEILLSGTEAWNQKFINKIIELRKKEEFKNNLFLNSLQFDINYTTRTKEIRFKVLNKLTPEQKLKYTNEFDKLDIETINEFIKYSALNQGLTFSGSSYTLVINPKYFEGLDQALNEKFYNLINPNKFKNEQENDLNNYLENFAIQLAGNYANKLKDLPETLLRGGYKNTESGFNEETKTYFDLSFNLNDNTVDEKTKEVIKGYKKFEEFPLFITNKFRDKLYIKIQDENNKVVYYQLVDKLKLFKIYQTNKTIEKGLYKLEDVFKNNLLVISLRNILKENNDLINETTVNYKVVQNNNLKIGDIIGIRNYSDLSRLNLKKVEIKKIEEVDPNNSKLTFEEIKEQIETVKTTDTETVESLSREKLQLEKKKKTVKTSEKWELNKKIKEIQEKLNLLKRDTPVLKQAEDKFSKIIEKLSNKFYISYESLSAEEALIKKKEINPQTQDTVENITHFYYKGKVIFVKEKLTNEAIFHEFSHPFIQAISYDNLELFENLYKEAVKNDKTLESYIKNLYPELIDKQEFKEELIVTALGRLASKDYNFANNDLKNWLNKLLKTCCELINRIFMLGDPIKISDLKGGNITLQELSLLLNSKIDINLENKSNNNNLMSMKTSLLDQIVNNNENINLPDNTIVGSKYTKNGKLYDRITEFVTDKFTTYKYSTSIEKADRAFKNRNLSKTTDKISITVNNIVREFTYDEYINLLNIQNQTNIVRGKILHLLLQKITVYADISLNTDQKDLLIKEIDSQITQLAAPKENIQNEINLEREFDWLFATDGNDETSEVNRKNIYTMLHKLGINLFEDVKEEERDKIKAEIPIVSDLLGLGTTLDNLIEHSDGTLGLIDWKYSTMTNYIKNNKLMLYAKDLGIEDNSLNHYMLEMTIRAMIIKEQNPDAKFREIKVVGLKKSIGFDNNDVDLTNMLNLLKTYYKNTNKELYEKLNDKKLFDSSEYYAQSKYFSEDAILNDTTLTTEQKAEKFIDELKTKYNNGKANSPEDAKEIKRITLIINELKANKGTNFNELLTKAQKEELSDIGLFKRWFGNKYSIDNKFVTAVTDVVTGGRNRARKRILEIMREADSRLEEVIKEYMMQNGLQSTLSKLSLGKINLIKYASKELNGKGLYDFMWKLHDDGLQKSGYYANLDYTSMTEAQRNYAEYYRETITELDKLLDEVVYVKHGVIYTIRDLAKVQKIDDDFMPRVPKKADEAIENDGLKAPLNWFGYKYNDFTESFKQNLNYAKNSNEGIPVKYRGNSEIIEKGEHTFNAHIALHAYVTNMIMKSELDDAYTFAQATLTVFQGIKNNKGDLIWKNAKSFLEDFIDLNILDIKRESKFSKKSVKIYKKVKDENGKMVRSKTDYYEINWDTFLRGLKSWVSATSMWLQPIAGGFNTVLIFMLNHKDSIKGSIAKKLGVPIDEINFTLSDMIWADKEYSKFQALTLGGFRTEAMENNKVHLMLKELNYMPDAYDYKIKPSDLKGGKNPLFDESHLYVFHAIGEEYGTITILLAQLHHLKNQETGKSIWDSYDVENGKLVWKGGVRFNKRNSDGSTTEVTSLTDEEINRLKRVNSTIQGGYRDDERVSIELYALGNLILQFKKFLPSQLENLFQSKYDDKSLGKWVKLDQKDLNGKNLYQWQALANEGRIWVVMRALAYYFTKNNEAYKWENLSSLQKQGFIDTAITVLFFLVAILAFDSDDDKKFTKQERAWRVRTRRLLEDLTSGTDPRDILRSSTTQITMLPKLMKTIDAFSQFIISSGEKGGTELRKSVPVLNAEYNWERYLGGEKPKR